MRKMLMAAAVAATMAAAPATAQVAVGNLVNVQIGDIDILRNSLNNNDVRILNDFLNNNNISATTPITVQVPLGVAANVCGDAAVALLAQIKQTGSATCTATNSSRAMSNAIVRTVQNQ